MRKLLIFMLVLGLASVANAVTISGVELSVNTLYDGPDNVTNVDLDICDYLVIDAYGPEGLDWLGYVFITNAWPGAPGEWGDDDLMLPEAGRPYPRLDLCNGYYYEHEGYPIVYPEAGDMATIIRAEVPGFGFGYEVGDNDTGVNPGGTSFELIYHCCGPFSELVTIVLYDASDLSGPQDTIVVHQVPEPATIALLGLGSLFLMRRRRK